MHVKKYDIIAAIADPLNQLICNRSHYGVKYRNCFVGSAVLKFLVKSNIVLVPMLCISAYCYQKFLV